MTVVTISRPYGSGGGEIAMRVAELLGYRFFDKTLMAQVAAEVGLSEDEIVDFSERDYKKTQNFLDRLLRLVVVGKGRPSEAPPSVAQVSTWQGDATGARVKVFEKVSEQQTLTMVKATIHAAYERGNVIIMGRGGQVILQNQPGVLHVRLEASLDTRSKRIQDQNNIELAEAQKLVNERDKASASYLKRFHNVDWADPLLYHLIINTGKWDLETAANMIVAGVRSMK